MTEHSSVIAKLTILIMYIYPNCSWCNKRSEPCTHCFIDQTLSNKLVQKCRFCCYIFSPVYYADIYLAFPNLWKIYY